MSKKGIVLLILSYIAVIIITVCITLLLVDNKVESKDDEINKNEVDYDKEVVSLCSKVDRVGNYNKDVIISIDKEIEKIDIDSNYTDKAWKYMKGKEGCFDYNCIIFENNNSKKYHSYDCETEELETSTFDLATIRSDITLTAACSNVNSKGNYYEDVDGDGSVECENFICTTRYQGKTYTRDCKY